MDAATITEQLAGLPIPDLRFFERIGSTNDEALGWISNGAQDGCLVIADLQTEGRGRLGRRWVTRSGAALAFSLILRPAPEEIERLGLFSPLGALAISQALEELLGLEPQIKWPNDVLLGRRKVAGILVEAAWTGMQIDGIVIGIGINVTPEAVPPAGELLFPATSVEEETGRPVDRVALLREILQALFDWRARIAEDAFWQAWERHLAFRNEWVRIEETTPGSPPVIGQLVGLRQDGSLLLRDSSGKILPVAVGDVRLRPVE